MAQVDNLMSIPRPTDLSIKSCMAQKYDVDFDPSNCRMFPNISPEGQQNSPVALVFDGGVSKLENAAARLVVLDSLFAHQNGLVPNLASPASPTYETSPPLKRQRTRDGHFNFMSGLKANHRADQRETTKSSSPPTPTGRGRGCRRKGGWKFHDLSDESDGLGRRKRTYCNNRLENEILQVYQDRITIKDVAGGKNGERLVVIEPSTIHDPDIVKHNTALRLILNKKKGIYKLQLLPFTVEQGSLSNKSQMILIVSKMLGDNGEVVCPGIAKMRHQRRNKMAAEERSASEKAIESTRKSWAALSNDMDDSYKGRWKMLSDQSGCSSNKEDSAVTPTDRLLISLNMELSRNKNSNQTNDQLQNESSCLLWHNPSISWKGKRLQWPEEFKYCVNCMRKSNGHNTGRNNPTIIE